MLNHSLLMDLYKSGITGWAFAHHLGTELVAAALAMALVHRRPPQGLIHHSDRGVQYASGAYRQVAQGAWRGSSMNWKGCCYDNAAMEAFFTTLKVECVHRHRFAAQRSAQREIFGFIESFYNRRRRHSALGYLARQSSKT